MKYIYTKQIFDNTAYDGSCDFSAVSAAAEAGKNWLLAVWNSDGTKVLAVAGQQSLTINRSADSIEINAKDTEGGWKAKLAGMKEWSIDQDGLFIQSSAAHTALTKAFNDGTPVCIKVYDAKAKKGLFGGLAVITDYPLEAPYDDAVTYSITLEGVGALVDFSIDTPTTDTLPE